MATDPLAWIDDELQQLSAAGLRTNIRTIESPMDAWVTIDGRRLLNFCANNYLGLANHPRLRQAAKDAIDHYGIGPGAVRTIAGTTSLHVELEERLAAFKHAEACITLQSGFAANLATIPALVGPEDVIFSDELNHASIIDACRLSRATVVRYAHNDMDDLQRRIAETQVYRRRMIVSDGVFSMDGDIAPLDQLVRDRRRTRHHPDGGRRPRRGRAGQGRAWHRGPFWPARPRPCRGRHAQQGLWRRRRPGRRAQVDRRLAAPARPSLPLLQCDDRPRRGRLYRSRQHP